ncbi:acetate non-utilizing protein 9 [Steccherinum ochraceum]|uniref:Succinate dehydrogenase assembly factor 3 n=1 Tax=Steccherinum ochraceum TaxID=92696 RepID=A0A4R0R8I7_9APHY|nr:acetate non-utilizing protein 9 [Steccherinum ochraceum]
MALRPSLVRLAESISSKPLTLREANATLLPPIPILRAHRHLPEEMRSLGDAYIKDEFRRHRGIDNPLHIIGFLSQWKVYSDELPAGPDGQHFKGKKLDISKLERMSSEQLGQLYELMQATKDVWKPKAEEDGPDSKP